MEIKELIAHVHPYDRPALGPSTADYAALQKLGQKSSLLLEPGQEIRFGSDDAKYLKLFGNRGK